MQRSHLCLLVIAVGCLVAVWLGRDFLTVTTLRSHRVVNFAFELSDADAFLDKLDGWLTEHGFEKTKTETASDNGGRKVYYYRGRWKDSTPFAYRVTRLGSAGAWTISDVQTWELGRVSAGYRDEMEKCLRDFEHEVDRWIDENSLRIIDPR